jgi:hypothetical protein
MSDNKGNFKLFVLPTISNMFFVFRFRCYDDENNPEMQLDQALENEMIYREPLMAGPSS